MGNENMERVRKEELISSRNHREQIICKTAKNDSHRNTLIEQSTTLVKHLS